jgi:hypothetical protein
MMLVGTQFMVREPLVLAWYFSMTIDKDRWVTLSCDWYETEKERLDYWELKAQETSLPPGVTLDEQRSMVGASDIFLGAQSPVTSIKVFTKTCPGYSETVTYDHGLLFTRRDGVDFCIAVEEAIANRLVYCRDEMAIRQMLDGCESRSII